MSIEVRESPSGFYAECFGEDCDWWGALEDCWHPGEDPDDALCGSCMRPIKSVWRAISAGLKRAGR